MASSFYSFDFIAGLSDPVEQMHPDTSLSKLVTINRVRRFSPSNSNRLNVLIIFTYCFYQSVVNVILYNKMIERCQCFRDRLSQLRV